MIVLNVGGGPTRHLPAEYSGYEQHLLDIDPSVNPDICFNAVELSKLSAHYAKYDVVYCSHNLEHYYKHDVPKVLDGFWSVLKTGGTVEIHVPNIKHLMQTMLAGNLDVSDVWYRLNDGTAITFHDVLYGWNQAMSSGNVYYAHKCGFTPLSLHQALFNAGFVNIQVIDQGSNLLARAEKE